MIKVTKTDSKNFNVSFSKAIEGPAGISAGQEVPVEWLQAALSYYATNRKSDGSLSQDDHERVKMLW